MKFSLALCASLATLISSAVARPWPEAGAKPAECKDYTAIYNPQAVNPSLDTWKFRHIRACSNGVYELTSFGSVNWSSTDLEELVNMVCSEIGNASVDECKLICTYAVAAASQ